MQIVTRPYIDITCHHSSYTHYTFTPYGHAFAITKCIVKCVHGFFLMFYDYGRMDHRSDFSGQVKFLFMRIRALPLSHLLSLVSISCTHSVAVHFFAVLFLLICFPVFCVNFIHIYRLALANTCNVVVVVCCFTRNSTSSTFQMSFDLHHNHKPLECCCCAGECTCRMQLEQNRNQEISRKQR